MQSDRGGCVCVCGKAKGHAREHHERRPIARVGSNLSFTLSCP